MHPKKNRCITFLGGWKNRGLETNAMTLRRIQYIQYIVLLYNPAHFHDEDVSVIFCTNHGFRSSGFCLCNVFQWPNCDSPGSYSIADWFCPDYLSKTACIVALDLNYFEASEPWKEKLPNKSSLSVIAGQVAIWTLALWSFQLHGRCILHR